MGDTFFADDSTIVNKKLSHSLRLFIPEVERIV